MERQNPVDEGPAPERLLGQHRRDIEALDRRILHLVCERLELARQVGELKRRCRIPLRNFEVEARVLGRFEKACGDLGLDPSLGTDLALFLIDKAVAEQASQMDTDYEGDALEAVVVGGKGGMGAWMARFLAGQGHRVSVVDPAPGACDFPLLDDLAEARDADLVLLAVPMTETARVLEEVARSRPRGVVAEMCSLKGHLAGRLAALRRQGLRLVSFHPLFGPGARMLTGRTVVFCNEGRPEDLARVRGLFEATSAELVEMDLAEHDRRMAVVLGMTHLANLAYARALAHSGVGAKELAAVAGVTFQRQLATTREVARENPDLYYQIQALNALTPQTAAWLTDAVTEWREAALAGDARAFSELMERSRAFLDEGLAETPGRPS